MLSALPILVALGLARAGEIYSGSNTQATFYYDLTNTICTDSKATTGGGLWAKGPNSAHPLCEPDAGSLSYTQIGSNSIVAFKEDMVHADKAKWCGKEVQVFDSSGKEVQGPDGPFYIWDGCQDCDNDNHLDYSGLAWKGFGGNCDEGPNPTGISYKVLDNNIRQWAKESPAGQGGGGAPSTGLQSTSTAVPVTTSSVQQAPRSVVPAPASGSCSTLGKYQCTGTTFQQCNYVGQPARLDWQTITPACATYCNVNRTPMCA